MRNFPKPWRETCIGSEIGELMAEENSEENGGTQSGTQSKTHARREKQSKSLIWRLGVARRFFAD